MLIAFSSGVTSVNLFKSTYDIQNPLTGQRQGNIEIGTYQ